MTTPDQTMWRERYADLGRQVCRLANIDARTVPADARIVLDQRGVTIEHVDVTAPGFRTTEHHAWLWSTGMEEDDSSLSDTEWAAFQAIPGQGFSHRAWIDVKIGQRTLEIAERRDHWRQCFNEAREETEIAEDTSNSLIAELNATRARLRRASDRIRSALDILDGRYKPTDRIGDLHGAMTSVLRGDL